MREKKLDTFHVVPNFYRTPIPKFNFEMMLLACRRASENFDCYPKMGKKYVFGAWPGGMFFLFFKAKNEEKLKKMFGFSFVQVKNLFAYF